MPVSHKHETLPGHLISLEQDEWAVWKCFVLRGAGFPARLVNAMKEEACGHSADRLSAAAAELECLYASAIVKVSTALEKLKQAGEHPDSDRYRRLVKTLRNLKSRKPDAGPELADDFNAALEPIITQQSKLEQLRAEYERSFAEGLERQYENLRNVARDSRFQEAVLWQNRGAFHRAIRAVLKESSRTTSKTRQHLELIASYLQRYCTKNDTIGFFGPIAWGTIAMRGAGLDAVPGALLIKKRSVFLELWAGEKIAEAIAALPGIEWWLPPRLASNWRIENDALIEEPGNARKLSALETATLALCNGKNMAADILSALRSDQAFEKVTEDQFHRLLDDMAKAGALSWQFTMPMEVGCEKALRAQVLQIRDPQLRQKALDLFAFFSDGLEQIALSAGDPERLDSALGQFEQSFEQVTHQCAQRRPGEAYAARTLIHEDCVRDLALTITPAFFEPIRPALLMMLQSLRWLAQSASVIFLDLFRKLFDRAAAKLQNPEIPVSTFVGELSVPIFEAIYSAAHAAHKQYCEKWAALLPIPSDVRVAQFASCLLRDGVKAAFPDLPGQYHVARYHSPDLMVSAPDAQTIQRGEALYILGETHVAVNTIAQGLFTAQHPNIQELLRGLQWDYPQQRRLNIIHSRKLEGGSPRTRESLFNPADLFLSMDDTAPPTGCWAYRPSDLFIARREGRLGVFTRDGLGAFDLLEAFAGLLIIGLMNAGRCFQPASYTPRIQIDKLVIQRETWRASVEELAFANEKTESDRFLSARTSMRARGVPALLFVKSPLEPKPFYLDMDSPVYVEMLCKMVRRLGRSRGEGSELSFSEMLPDSDGAWLTDAQGERYTSEFRFVMVDLKSRVFSEESCWNGRAKIMQDTDAEGVLLK
jgi:Lantibiotic dehydratase, N terminus